MRVEGQKPDLSGLKCRWEGSDGGQVKRSEGKGKEKRGG